MNEGQMVIEAPATLNALMETVATEVAAQPVIVVTPENVTAPEVTTPVVVTPEAIAVAAEAPVKKKGKKKRAPGRPLVYNGKDRIVVAAALKKHGLTKGIAFLAKERNLKISMTLARAVAAEKGLTFQRGRPKVAA